MIVKNVKVPPNGAITYELQSGTQMAEQGAEGTNAFYGHISETYIPSLEWPDVYDKYNEMRRRDPTIRSMINAVKLLARQAEWKAEGATDSGPDLEASELLQSNLEDMSHTVEDFIDDVLTFLPFGWSSFELTYKRRNGIEGKNKSLFDDQRIGWRKFAFRRQSTLDRWEFDKAGGFGGWWQLAPPDYRTTLLPAEKLMHFVGERDGNNPEGLCLSESIYEPWHFVKNLQIINGIGWQRTFVGLPVFTFEEKPSTNDKSRVEQIGQGLSVDEKQYVSLPPKVKLTLESTSNTGAASLLDTIKFYRALMLQTIMAEFIMMASIGTGSFAQHKDKSDLFLMAVNGYLDKIAAIWNRFGVARLFEFEANRIPGLMELPRVTHSTVHKIELEELGNYVQKVASFITVGDEDQIWLRRQAGMPEMLPEGEPEMPEVTGTQPETGEGVQDDELPGEMEAGELWAELAEFDGRDDDRATIEGELEDKLDKFFSGQLSRIKQEAEAGRNPGDDDDFWKNEEKIFRKELRAALANHINELIGYIAEDTEAAYRISADFGLVNEAALDWAKKFAGQEVKQINATTRKAVRKAVSDWIETGGTLDDLVKSLQPLSFSRTRARNIAATEVTTAYAEGNVNVWMASGMATDRPLKMPVRDSHIGCRCWLSIQFRDGRWIYVWNTAEDEVVCPICRPLSGTEVGVAREDVV
jgi:hypothetical protein